jgi:hypothetical protein
MGAKENVTTIRTAKTITATTILRENGWLKTMPRSKGDKGNYIRISIITCVLYQTFLKVDRQRSRHGEMINV